MEGRPRPGRRRVLRPDPDRFVDGITRLTERLRGPGDEPVIHPGLEERPGILIPPGLGRRPREETPDLVFDVIRPVDLVAFRVEVFGLELVSGANPVLRTGDEDGHLVLHLAFQHMTERAVYEAPPPDTPDPPHAPPERAIAANGSRLVFRVAANSEIPYSTEGLLAAVATLPMAVHPLARPVPMIRGFPDWGIGLTLEAEMVAVATADGLRVGGATNAHPATDRSTVEGLTRVMRDRRVARAIEARLGAFSIAGMSFEADDEGSATEVSLGGRTFETRPVGRPGGLLGHDLPIGRLRKHEFSRPPRQFETALEVPYRLIMSPSEKGGWAHSTAPAGAAGGEERVELWHTRLGVRQSSGGVVRVNERSKVQRILRAVWARDRDEDPDWQTVEPLHDNVPFRMSLDSADRHILVRQTAEEWVGVGGEALEPDPVTARKLYLSAVGAWLDVVGQWEADPYAAKGLKSIESWDHIAPMGRDQFVKVVYPGYLFPFGHRASLVKITERKMKTASPSIAGLYQRKFLIIKEPVLRYGSSDFPLTEIRLAPLVTPNISDPGPAENTCFVPHVGAGNPFHFILHARDKEDRPVRVSTPLVWVALDFNPPDDDANPIRQLWTAHARVPFSGQKVAYAAVRKGGDTVAVTSTMTVDGASRFGGSTPRMVSADVTIDAVEQLSGVGTTRIAYHGAYLSHGFGSGNAGEVWAHLVRDETAGDPFSVVPDAPQVMSFGEGSPSGSDSAGGFIQPNVAIGGLSRLKGTVNDVDNVAGGGFDPAAFLGAALPKLFGVVSLVDLLQAVGVDLDDAPDLVSETLDRIESFIEDLERAKRLAEEAVAEANRMVALAQQKATELQQAAQDALTAAQALQTQLETAVDDVLAQLNALVDQGQSAVESALQGPLDALATAVAAIRDVAPLLPPAIRSRLLSLADVLETVLEAADLVEDIVRFLNGLGSSSTQFTYRYEWVPRLQSWPAPPDSPVLELQEDSLVLAVEGRLDGKGKMGVDVVAELRDFALHLMPGADLVAFNFDHLSFKGGTDGKAEVDVVMGEIEFVGILGFVEKVKELIPFDGFSDPPYLDVTPAGLTAGFSVDLPNVAVGVFSLSNMSLGADVRVPFLGDTVSVGFNFCTRERPFTLAVTFIGGGGFFGLRLGPDKLLVLELCLEAGATLSVDFGVASGSISAMVGIYLRLEGDAGSLTGYFRLRGEVDVLGLISASIELYLELTYDFPTGKMVGKAKLTIKVEVLCFSASVTIQAERRLAGSNGDPGFFDVMGLEPDGTSPAWSDYCLAFAAA